MTMIRVHKSNNYSVICNVGLQDINLSWKAKGMLSYLLTLPDDWQIYVTELTKHSKDGIDSVKSIMKELIKAGYIHREKDRVRNEKGQLKNYIYTVYETPQEKNADEKEKSAPKNEKPASLGTEGFEPRVDFPTQGKPTQENPPLLNTNLTKYELDIKNKEKTTQGGAPAEIEILKSFRECISANLTKREITKVQELAQDFKQDLVIRAIEYACDSNKKNLNYIKALLQDWTSKGIQTSEDIDYLIAEWRTKNQKAKKNHEAKVTRNADGTVTYPKKQSSFNNFKQREYDWEKLERQLLGRLTPEEEEEMNRGYGEGDEDSKEWMKRVLADRHTTTEEVI